MSGVAVNVTVTIPTHGGKIDVQGALVIDSGVGLITIRTGQAECEAVRDHLATGPCDLRIAGVVSPDPSGPT